MIAFSLAWLVLIAAFCTNWYHSNGILFFLDFNRVGMIIWCLGICLYDLELSDLYHPSYLINVIALVVVCLFWLFESRSNCDSSLLKKCFSELSIPDNRYYWTLIALVALLAFIAFLINANAGELRALSNNPGMRVEFKFGYLYRLCVPVAICFYIVARLEKRKLRKILCFGLSIAFFVFTAFDLSRGPIVWILTGILLFELLYYLSKTGKKGISKKTIVAAVGVLVFVVVVFDWFGSIRTATHFSNVATHYQMNINIPDGLTWIYIYISSSLENARYAIENISVETPTFGAYLFYPFIKLASNIAGLDGEFTTWLASCKCVYAYMSTTVGLTVGSFLIDAYQDFSYLGFVIYPLFYGLVSLAVKKMLEWRRLLPLTRLIVYALAIQISLWSIFDDTVFLGPLWVCAFVVIGADLLSSLIEAWVEKRCK